MSLGKKANMFRRIQLRTAGAVVALVAAPLGVLSSQTPQSAPTTGQTPPINPPVIQNPTTPKSSSGETGTTSSRAEVAADSNFIRDAVAGNLLEVRLGTIARDKAADGDVKAFGRRMVSQHSTMRDQWRDLARRYEVNTTLSLDPAVEEAANKLATLSGAEFDRAYLSEMVQAHQADIAKFQQASSSADAPVVRQLATNALPAMQQHLSQAQQLASQDRRDRRRDRRIHPSPIATGTVATGTAATGISRPRTGSTSTTSRSVISWKCGWRRWRSGRPRTRT